jgi:hypothetical protein
MLYIAKWPNGDFSIVHAETEGQALYLLDEVGDPSAAVLTPLEEDTDVLINFKKIEVKDAEGELFEFESFGEDMFDLCSDVGIELYKAEPEDEPEAVVA